MFDYAQCADQRPRHPLIADFKIKQRALGLRAPVFVGGHLDRAEGVGFDASIIGVCFHALSFCRRRNLFNTAQTGRSDRTTAGKSENRRTLKQRNIRDKHHVRPIDINLQDE